MYIICIYICVHVLHLCMFYLVNCIQFGLWCINHSAQEYIKNTILSSDDAQWTLRFTHNVNYIYREKICKRCDIKYCLLHYKFWQPKPTDTPTTGRRRGGREGGRLTEAKGTASWDSKKYAHMISHVPCTKEPIQANPSTTVRAPL